MPRGRGHGPRMSNEKAKDFKGTMKKLMAYLSAYKIGIFFVIVFAIGSTIFNIVGPKILGNSTGLSAFWVVTSILLGGGLFGFVGMVMGVPTFAVIYYIVNMILDNKLKKKKLPVRSDSYDEWSYVDSSGEYIHSEEIKSKAEEK